MQYNDGHGPNAEEANRLADALDDLISSDAVVVGAAGPLEGTF